MLRCHNKSRDMTWENTTLARKFGPKASKSAITVADLTLDDNSDCGCSAQIGSIKKSSNWVVIQNSHPSSLGSYILPPAKTPSPSNLRILYNEGCFSHLLLGHWVIIFTKSKSAKVNPWNGFRHKPKKRWLLSIHEPVALEGSRITGKSHAARLLLHLTLRMHAVPPGHVD